MRDAIALVGLLDDPNVRAFLAVIRAGEGTADAGGYSRHFGGKQFEDFNDHPRKVITAGLGRNQYTSTAAGAYQFLARTWDGLVRQYGFADFRPSTQDIAALALIDGRRALDDVLAGRFDDAVRKCAREWASLPGSPYGQPTKTADQARATYLAAGGLFVPNAGGEPAPEIFNPADQPAALLKEPTMPAPLIPIIAALLPSFIEAIPKLGKLFGSGSEVAERNVAAAELAVGIVQQAVGARNAQEAAEIVAADPAAAQLAIAAVEARWYELTESGGGGIDGARKANAVYLQPGAAGFWLNPSFWISLILISMPLLLLVDVLFVHPESYVGELRTQIVTGVLMVIGMVGGYWIGTSISSAKKDDRRVA